MSRPEHLSVPNTSEGIRRINEMQEKYDRDPQAWEAEERARAEQAEQEAMAMAEAQAEQAESEYY